MNLKKTLKKPVNFNLVFVLVVAVLLLIIATIAFLSIYDIKETIDNIKNETNEMRNLDDIGDVEGYGLIVNSLYYSSYKFLTPFAVFIFIKIPFFTALGLILFSIIARIVYNKGIIKAYRILMGFCYFFILAFAIFYTMILLNTFVEGIIAVIIDLTVAIFTILAIRNTYTKRILQN